MGALPCRIILSILNLITLLLGAGCLISGIVVLVDVSKVKGLFGEKGFITDKVNDIPNNAIQQVLDSNNIVKVAGGCAVAFGSIVVIVSLIGFIGFMMRSKFLLFIYIAIMCILILIKVSIIIAVVVSGNKLVGFVQTRALDEIKKSYDSGEKVLDKDTKTSSTTLLINVLQVHKKCCFVSKISDLDGSKWKKQIGESKSDAWKVLQMPATCCMLNEADRENGKKSNWGDFFKDPSKRSWYQCARSGTGIYKESCAEKVVDQFKSMTVPVVIMLGVTMGFELLCILAAIITIPRLEQI